MATKDKPKKTKFKPEADDYRKNIIKDSRKHLSAKAGKHKRHIYN